MLNVNTQFPPLVQSQRRVEGHQAKRELAIGKNGPGRCCQMSLDNRAFTTFSLLPVEVIYEFYYFLNAKEILLLSLCSKQLFNIGQLFYKNKYVKVHTNKLLEECIALTETHCDTVHSKLNTDVVLSVLSRCLFKSNAQIKMKFDELISQLFCDLPYRFLDRHLLYSIYNQLNSDVSRKVFVGHCIQCIMDASVSECNQKATLCQFACFVSNRVIRKDDLPENFLSRIENIFFSARKDYTRNACLLLLAWMAKCGLIGPGTVSKELILKLFSFVQSETLIYGGLSFYYLFSALAWMLHTGCYSINYLGNDSVNKIVTFVNGYGQIKNWNNGSELLNAIWLILEINDQNLSLVPNDFITQDLVNYICCSYCHSISYGIDGVKLGKEKFMFKLDLLEKNYIDLVLTAYANERSFADVVNSFKGFEQKKNKYTDKLRAS